MNAPVIIPHSRKGNHPDPRHKADLDRLDRAIAALQAARRAAMCGMLFASKDGLVAVQACRALWQSDDLDTLYHDVWSEAGCPLSDEIDDRIRALPHPHQEHSNG